MFNKLFSDFLWKLIYYIYISQTCLLCHCTCTCILYISSHCTCTCILYISSHCTCTCILYTSSHCTCTCILYISSHSVHVYYTHPVTVYMYMYIIHIVHYFTWSISANVSCLFWSFLILKMILFLAPLVTSYRLKRSHDNHMIVT